MAILKTDSYGSNVKIETGDDDFDNEHVDQLRITQKELIASINAENVTDRLWARIIKIRKSAFHAMEQKVPGATNDS